MNKQWISISTLAKKLNVSEQTIRNRCKKGIYKTMVFKRGKMNGILIEWKDEQGA